jgi:UDP-N-acetylglucosamine 2-epimerase (non-hydrolysing)
LKKLCIVFGTRPEAIKLAPVIDTVGRCSELSLSVCVTGQHRELLDQVLDIYKIKPNFDLNIMSKSQSLEWLTASVITEFAQVLDELNPDAVLVHGDTTSAMGGALAAFYKKIPVYHVEAGLRTGSIYSPWPEELNRKIIASIATLHFAPTETARENLISEGINQEKIVVTGNTCIDALLQAVETIANYEFEDQKLIEYFTNIASVKKIILVTGHRRENFGGGMEDICNALISIAKRNDVYVVYCAHPNPSVWNIVSSRLNNVGNIEVIKPLDYLTFIKLLTLSYLVITDSGGIQEEAPSLGKPVLVTREFTERPEAVLAGTVKLVGSSTEMIVREVLSLVDDRLQYQRMSTAHNPYGDGRASKRIIKRILVELNGK